MEHLKHPGRFEALIPTNGIDMKGTESLVQTHPCGWSCPLWSMRVCRLHKAGPLRAESASPADLLGLYSLSHIFHLSNQFTHETWSLYNLIRGTHERFFPFGFPSFNSFLNKYWASVTFFELQCLFYIMRTWEGPFWLWESMILNIYQRLAFSKVLG